jgi:hypothetical protein
MDLFAQSPSSHALNPLLSVDDTLATALLVRADKVIE